MQAETGPQGDLFGTADLAPAAHRARRSAAPVPIAPATLPAHLSELATALPAGLRLGTSSWSFPGWRGLVYAAEHRESELARYGLTAYAAHPLLRAVGVDRSFYAPLREQEWRAYAQAVPADFRFLVKAHAALTIPPGGARPAFLERSSESFLDADHARRAVIEPLLEGLGDKLGVLLLQFSPLPRPLLRDRRPLLDRLSAFLEQLPRGLPCALEWRDPEMLDNAYAALLERRSVQHCVSVHPRLPSPAAQWRFVQPGPVYVRWLLHRSQRYEQARERYAPFDRLVDPDPENREMLADFVTQTLAVGREVLLIANNKAEGSAPLTLFEFARAVHARRRLID